MEKISMQNIPFNQKKVSNEKILELRSLFHKKIMENIEKNNNKNIDFYLIWKDTNNLQELYEQLEDIKKCLDSFRPFSESQIKNLNDFFDLEYTYHSNKIEGNTLTKSETYLIVSKGLTVGGKTINEHLEAQNHQFAIDYIRDLVKNNIEFNKFELLNIHQLILQKIDLINSGKYRNIDVKITSSLHEPPSFLQVPQLMDNFFKFYEENRLSMHPVEFSSEIHERLVTIHPFVDGNGRTARLVMNLILLQNGYPITIIGSEENQRLEYYDYLELAQTGQDPNKEKFKLMIAKNVKNIMFQYLNLIAPNGNEESLKKGGYFFERIKEIL